MIITDFKQQIGYFLLIRGSDDYEKLKIKKANYKKHNKHEFFIIFHHFQKRCMIKKTHSFS